MEGTVVEVDSILAELIARTKGKRRPERAQPATAPRLRKRRAPASGGRRGGGGAEVEEAAVVGENRARSGVGKSGIFYS